MRFLLVPFGFVAGALAGFIAELGIVTLIERVGAVRIELPLLLVPVLPAAIGLCGAILLLSTVRRTSGAEPSLLSLVNALATVALLILAMVAALGLMANRFDRSPTSVSVYSACMLAPVLAMLVAWGIVRRSP